MLMLIAFHAFKIRLKQSKRGLHDVNDNVVDR